MARLAAALLALAWTLLPRAAQAEQESEQASKLAHEQPVAAKLTIAALELELDLRDSKEEWMQYPATVLETGATLQLIKRTAPTHPELVATLVHFRPDTPLPLTGAPASVEDGCAPIMTALAAKLELEPRPTEFGGRYYPVAVGDKGVIACRAMADGSKISLLVGPTPGKTLETSQASVIVEAFLEYSGVGRSTTSSARDNTAPSTAIDEKALSPIDLTVFPHFTYMHAECALTGDFRGYGLIRNSLSSLRGDGPMLLAMSMDVGYGSSNSGGFAFELALSPLGYALAPVKGVALGALIGGGMDGVSGGRLHYSFYGSATAFLKVGTENYFLFARADNIWLHRAQRKDGSPHALLDGDELRAELGLRALLRGHRVGVAARAHEMRGVRFFGGSLGLYFL